MSVIGIDFGNESCYVAAAKAGGIETLANDYSLRATPSCVAFDGKKRIIGVAAKNQQVTNMKNTVSGFKRLLGRKFNDPQIQSELSSIPTKTEPLPEGNIGIRVNYLGQEQSFTPEQLTAMLLTKLKETSTYALQVQVNDCVITCPSYFTNAERRALLDAAHIAGLNVLRLMNETTATALSYGFYKQDLPDEKPRNVIFIDCGHSSLQVSACAFTKGKLKMLASAWDQHVGGRDFDALMADHFSKEFSERYKINAKSNARAYLRLLTEVEKLKKQMSANSTKLPLGIECFMNDIDVSSSMQRTEMEQICANLFMRVEATFVKLLRASNLTTEDIHSVEIVGGSTRIPAIKNLIEKVFGRTASTTLNQDESVSRGAALQCAIMSPAVRVREFGVTDIQNYPVKVSWDAEGPLTAGEMEVYPVFHSAPFSRMLTINRKEPFMLTLQYAQDVPYPDHIIGRWYIKEVKPNERGEAQEVKIKVRINNHGIVLISTASLVESKESDENPSITHDTKNEVGEENVSGDAAHPQNNVGEPMEILQEGSYNDDDDNATTASSPGGLGWAQRLKGWFTSSAPDRKKKNKLIELAMEVQTHGYATNVLNSLAQQEMKMIANDAKETERVDARNALEEYVYEMRNKLQGGSLERYVLSNDRESICSTLNEVENWLYEDGENCDREVYVNKLGVLQTKIDPIKDRSEDYENCPELFEELRNAINNARIAVNDFKKGSPKFEHLTETEFLNISESAEKAQKWWDIHFAKFIQSPRTSDSPVKASDIRQELSVLTSCVKSVINRPKPKTTPKQESKNYSKEGNADNEQNDSPNKNNGASGENFEDRTPANSNNIPDDTSMEVE